MSNETGLEFRKSSDDTVWHWCQNCKGWLRDRFETRRGTLPAELRCATCQALTEKGLCRG